MNVRYSLRSCFLLAVAVAIYFAGTQAGRRAESQKSEKLRTQSEQRMFDTAQKISALHAEMSRLQMVLGHRLRSAGDVEDLRARHEAARTQLMNMQLPSPSTP